MTEAGEDVPSPTRFRTTKALLKKGDSALGKTPSGRKSTEAGSDGSDVDFKPPKSVQNAAKKGLELRRLREKLRTSGEIGASESLGGTDIGVARAAQLMSGKNLSVAAIQRIASYLSRHEVDKDAEGFGDDQKPSAGYVAWLLWGGDPAVEWTRKLIARVDGTEMDEAIVDRPNKAKPVRGKGKAVANIFTANDITLNIQLNLDDLRNLIRRQELEIEARDFKARDDQSNVYRVLMSYNPKGSAK
jgi:hypothetical protein